MLPHKNWESVGKGHVAATFQHPTYGEVDELFCAKMRRHNSSRKPRLKNLCRQVNWSARPLVADASALPAVLSSTAHRGNALHLPAKETKPAPCAQGFVAQAGWVNHPSALSSLLASLCAKRHRLPAGAANEPALPCTAGQLLDLCESSLTASPRPIGSGLASTGFATSAAKRSGHTPPLPSFNHLVDQPTTHTRGAVVGPGTGRYSGIDSGSLFSFDHQAYGSRWSSSICCGPAPLPASRQTGRTHGSPICCEPFQGTNLQAPLTERAQDCPDSAPSPVSLT